ncbi:hypothetical protein E4U21_002380 [Claviceps maximensis]|nr:hypothetical protein E4U21_002380 [Claviceps maximensis]
MSRRKNRRNHDLQIRPDPHCTTEPLNDHLHTMDREDVVGTKEEHVDDCAVSTDVEGEGHAAHLAVNTDGFPPSVETVADEPGNGETQSSDSDVQEEPDADINTNTNTNTNNHNDSASRRASEDTSNMNDVDGIKRWPSVRTEALIQAAARDIVAHVASRPGDSRQSMAVPEEQQEEETSFVDGSYSDSPRVSFGGETDADQSHISDGHNEEPHHLSDKDDAGADSSSHHEPEDDVFSEKSPRSSMGSLSESDKQKISSPKLRSTRVSDIPQSDQDDDFVPTIRGTPRPLFRSPSSVQAWQMESPPASAIGSPRPIRRTPRPSISRLASPNVSARYSSKKTPPRFKRNTPPLVLLHVTLMPSRWPWGRVLDGAHPTDLSPEAKTLWDSWRQLQDRTGDTVSARGILLPHPQNDYEVLEERLLEALELPLKRRARILECGHYLGPSNEMMAAATADEDDAESDYDVDADADDCDGHEQSSRQSLSDATHWCTTCHSNIRYDSLGTGKVFRVKVYASNGLMRAGAWQACWKEMERVDVELEPVLDTSLQEELVHLAAEQERILKVQEEEAAADAAAAAVDEEIQLREEAEQAYAAELAKQAEQERQAEQQEVDASPAAEPELSAKPCSVYDDSGLTRDEERLREIYGHSPPPSHRGQSRSSAGRSPRHSDYFQQETPPSPSVHAYEHREEPSLPVPSMSAFGRSSEERREERRQEPRRMNEGASLSELLLEAIRVFLQDQKNVMIVLLSLLVLMLAVGSGGSQKDHRSLSENMLVPDTKAHARVETRTDALSQAATTSTPTASPSRSPAPAPVVASKPAAAADKPADDVWGAAGVVENPNGMPAPPDTCGVCSKALEVAHMSLKKIPTNTVELVSTVTRRALTTVTEELVSTITREALTTVVEELLSTITQEALTTVTETMFKTVTVGVMPMAVEGVEGVEEAVEEVVKVEEEGVEQAVEEVAKVEEEGFEEEGVEKEEVEKERVEEKITAEKVPVKDSFFAEVDDAAEMDDAFAETGAGDLTANIVDEEL